MFASHIAAADDNLVCRMWLIPIGTLLQCEQMPSHQEALAKGMLGAKNLEIRVAVMICFSLARLVQYTSEIAGRVIFGQ